MHYLVTGWDGHVGARISKMMMVLTTLHHAGSFRSLSSTVRTSALQPGRLHRPRSRIPVDSLASVAAPFSSSATTTPPWIDESTQTYKIFTDNAFFTLPTNSSTSHGSSLIPVLNPANRQHVIGHIVDPTTEQLDEVITKAQVAFHKWKHVPVQERQRVLFQFQHLIREQHEQLDAVITLENGKTLPDSHGDVHRGLEVVEAACQVAPLLLGQSLQRLSESAAIDCTSYRRPLGVCVGICPFNFPGMYGSTVADRYTCPVLSCLQLVNSPVAMIPLWMFPLAIAAGNSFVLKPSEKTPGAALLLAQLAAQAGLPPNVLQVVHGGATASTELITDERVRAVSFVGSNRAGEAIYNTATATGKRVQANLGAKNHAVLLPDADRRRSISAITGAGFGAAGQRCMAISVVITVGDDCSAWLEDLITEASNLVVGPGHVAESDVGPLISRESKERIEGLIAQAETEGAEILLDGRGVRVEGYPHGNFLGPTVLRITDTDNIAYKEELFGPVLTCLTVPTLDDAIQLINANRYGNGCALFTNSGGAARKFTTEVECGQVGINVPVPVPLPMFSFTGNKDSIRGDLNFYGATGVQFYTELQTVTTNWPYDETDQGELGDMTMPVMK